MKTLALFFALMLVCLAAWGRKDQPHLEFVQTEHDFGNISPKGGEVWYDFVFRNTGTAPLVIIKTATSCSCTKTRFPRGPIMPGEEAYVRVIYDPKSQYGPQFKAIQVYSNDPAKRSIITIKCDVQ